MPANDKHSSLLRTFVNYGRKKFYIIGSLSYNCRQDRSLPEGVPNRNPQRVYFCKCLIRMEMTDRQTHALPSIQGRAKIFNAFFDTFHFTMFALLNPFVKGKHKTTIRVLCIPPQAPVILLIFTLGSRQTDRQTHAFPSIQGWAKIFNAFFDTFLFTTFASLTPFIKDKHKSTTRGFVFTTLGPQYFTELHLRLLRANLLCSLHSRPWLNKIPLESVPLPNLKFGKVVQRLRSIADICCYKT